MHVFVDDSGCAGFKLGSGSSSHLILAACVFRDPLEIEHLDRVVTDCRRAASHWREFKYSKASKRVRSAYFAAIKPVDFHVRAIVIKKELIYSEKLRSEPCALKSFAIRMLLTRNYGYIQNSKVVIDGQDTKAFDIEDSAYLTRMVNREAPGTIDTVAFKDSNQSVGIQLADMVAGAINRAFRTDRPSSMEHLETFRSRTFQPKGTLWFWK